MTALHRCAHQAEAPAILRPGQPGTALFATALLGAEFVALYAAFMAYGPAAFAACSTSYRNSATSGSRCTTFRHKAYRPTR
ncbi:MAG: hypothetical protein QOC89_901 [Paraburkholderia sp.]|nr:hypothetical protein [Paraburkholderia sp.]